MSKKEEPKPAPTEHKVTILRRNEITTYPRINEPKQQMIITYIAADMAPASIRIMKDDWSLEVEKTLIKADIERRLKQKAESYTV